MKIAEMRMTRIFSAFLKTCFLKGSLIMHFVRQAARQGKAKNFLTRHRRDLGFVLLAPLLSIYWPINCLNFFKWPLNTIINDFLISYEKHVMSAFINLNFFLPLKNLNLKKPLNEKRFLYRN